MSATKYRHAVFAGTYEAVAPLQAQGYAVSLDRERGGAVAVDLLQGATPPGYRALRALLANELRDPRNDTGRAIGVTMFMDPGRGDIYITAPNGARVCIRGDGVALYAPEEWADEGPCPTVTIKP